MGIYTYLQCKINFGHSSVLAIGECPFFCESVKGLLEATGGNDLSVPCCQDYSSKPSLIISAVGSCLCVLR